MATMDVRFESEGGAAAALVIRQEEEDDGGGVMTGVPADVHTVRIILPVDAARTAGMRVAERLTRLLAQCSSLVAAELVGREVAVVGQSTADTTAASDLFCNTLLDALVSRQISALRLRCLAFADRHLPCLKYVLAGPRSLKHSLREVDLERVLLPDARAYRSIAKRLAHVPNLHTLRVDAPWLDGVAHYGLPAGVRCLTLQLSPSPAVASGSLSTAARRLTKKHSGVVVQMHHDFGAGSHPEEVASALFDCFPTLADMRHHAVELTVRSSNTASGSSADEMFRRTLFEILFVWLGRAHPALREPTDDTTTTMLLSEWSTAVLGLAEPLDAASLRLDLTVQLTEEAAHDRARHVAQQKGATSTKRFRAFMGCLERAGVFKARAVRCP